jgi:prephenate dehydrogenase
VKIAVLGVGLIGGSIGLAARRRLGASVVGYDPDARALATAVELGAIDAASDDFAEAVRRADYVFIATPVGAIPSAAREALTVAGAGCVVSDVGSTKRRVTSAISDPRFVGGHPLAGAETAGVEYAREDLFDGAVWYLTPANPDSSPVLPRLHGLIEQLGASPTAISAAAHDRLMASVSHLPHVLANVLVSQALRASSLPSGGAPGVSALGANPSFRDATRVAGANTAIWTDIYMSNADLLAEALDETIRELSGVRDALDAEDARSLAEWNERAREERKRLVRSEAPNSSTGPLPASETPSRAATPPIGDEPAGPAQGS